MKRKRYSRTKPGSPWGMTYDFPGGIMFQAHRYAGNRGMLWIHLNSSFRSRSWGAFDFFVTVGLGFRGWMPRFALVLTLHECDVFELRANC